MEDQKMEVLLDVVNKDPLYDEIVSDHLSDRRIILNREIEEDSFEMFMMILNWNREDRDKPVEERQKIFIYINSDGGNVIMGNLILDLIKTSKTPIVTVGFSKCASMASYILAAGHERYCFPSTVVLYHDGQAGYYTSGNKGRDIQKFYDRLEEKATSFMVQNTKMSPDFLEEIKDREYYIFSREAKDLGIVDKIIGVDCDIYEIL